MHRQDALPQLKGDLFLTDSGLETFLCFKEGVDLPDFAAFTLLATAEGRERLNAYMQRHVEIARKAGLGFIAETPTWRASSDWGARLGYDRKALKAVNRGSVEMLAAMKPAFEPSGKSFVVSGNIGPRGDGYDPDCLLSPEEAEAYHREQVETFAQAGADCVTAMTITHPGEAIGITKAAQKAGIPVVISFTTETDGRLPSGELLGEAIEAVDEATGNGPAYYMINCAHPTHFEDVIEKEAAWVGRLRGLRANASTRSHAELDEATELDEGNPAELAEQYRSLCERLPNLTVLGGCCGTDHRHVAAICAACSG